MEARLKYEAATAQEQAKIVERLRAQHRAATEAEQTARLDIARIHQDAPPEWVPIHLRSAQQNRDAAARIHLKLNKPEKGKEYDRHKSAVAQAQQRQRAAAEDAKQLIAVIKTAENRKQNLLAREARGVTAAASLFADFASALHQLRENDPAVGQRHSSDFDRTLWTRRAADALDRLNELAKGGWPGV